MNRLFTFTASLILAWIVGYLLIVGRGILIPIVIALFIWNLLNILNQSMKKIPVVGARLPMWFCWVLSFLVVTGMAMKVMNIISANVYDVIVASSRYQENLTHLFSRIDEHYRIKALMGIDGFLKDLSVQGILVNIYGVFTTITSSAILIILYVVFLFVEQHYFEQKMEALFPQQTHRQIADSIISHIVKDTQTYLGLKTMLSLMTAIASWVIMKWVGLDFAEFWALLIFFLNYIPNIGAILATVFPAFLAIIQFQSWVPFAIITFGLVLVQFIVGNLLEPRFLSQSLNLSTLVILFALAIWGAIWGILGMFLSVPITVIMLIVFAHFEATRPIAIFLSKDGYVKKAYQQLG